MCEVNRRHPGVVGAEEGEPPMSSCARCTVSTPETALEIAEQLLARGLTVAVAALHIGPFASLVARFGDRFRSISADRGTLRADPARRIEPGSGVDALLVVPAA